MKPSGRGLPGPLPEIAADEVGQSRLLSMSVVPANTSTPPGREPLAGLVLETPARAGHCPIAPDSGYEDTPEAEAKCLRRLEDTMREASGATEPQPAVPGRYKAQHCWLSLFVPCPWLSL